jgi:hypothetical protein
LEEISMTKGSLHSLGGVYRIRRFQRVSVVLVGAAVAACAYQSAVASRPKAAAKPIIAQALTFCRLLAPDCELDGEAQFGRERIPIPDARLMERPLWSVPVRSDGHRYMLILRGDTKRLCHLFELPNWERKKPAVGTAFYSAEQAIARSLAVMQRLKQVEPNAQIALKKQPQSVGSQDGWRVEWNVRTSPAQPPETVRLVLSKRDGRPLQLANGVALNANPQ